MGRRREVKLFNSSNLPASPRLPVFALNSIKVLTHVFNSLCLRVFVLNSFLNSFIYTRPWYIWPVIIKHKDTKTRRYKEWRTPKERVSACKGRKKGTGKELGYERSHPRLRYYQLDFVTPGIIPIEASSLNERRDNLNLRK